MTTLKQNAVCMGAILLILMLSTPYSRAEEEKKEVHFEPVTVYAQKREENVQRVPIAVNVLSDVQLEESRLYDFKELGKLIPNLYIASTGGNGTYSFVGIRGRINTGIDVDPVVTVLVDGVPYDDFYSMGGNMLFDVERVEVLKGPQSTMYGLNSVGGVINIISKQPGTEPKVDLFAETGSYFKDDYSLRIGAKASGPIVENVLSGKVALVSQRDAPFIYNNHTDDYFNDDLRFSAKGDLVWTPGKKWRVTGGLAYSKIYADSGYIMAPFNEKAASTIGIGNDKWEVDIDYEGMSRVETLASHLRVDYSADLFDVVSVSSYRKTDQKYEWDTDYTPATSVTGFGRVAAGLQSISQELRVQSKKENDSRQWTAGYFFHCFDRTPEMGYGNPATKQLTWIYSDARLKGDSHSLFGQFTQRVFDDSLGLTFGARQEWTSRDSHSNVGKYEDTKVHDSQFLPKFAVDYRFAPEGMVYASVTQGWRSGGLNHMAQNAGELKFKKETSWTYEIGSKTQWFENSLTVNAAAFRSIYTDYQDMVAVTPVASRLSNADKVVMTGIEADFQALVSQDMQVMGGFGYVNAEYEDFDDANLGNLKGNKVMAVPDFNANVAVKYSFLEHFYVRPEVLGVGRIYWDRANSTKQDPYAVFNLRVGYARDEMEVYLYGQNLTNEYSFTQTSPDMNGNFFGTPIAPLNVGVGVNWHF